MPFLSIIVTVYNLENYIAECLMSILTQPITDYELIIVNDGSSDKSALICQRFAKDYPDIVRFIDLDPPASLGRAHAIGFEQAKGRYIQLIDGDDYLAPNCLRDRIDLLHKKEPDILMGKFECVTEEGAVGLKDAHFDETRINEKPYEEVLQYLSRLPGFHMIFVRFIFKKSILKGMNLFHSNVSHKTTTNDWLPVIKILTSASSIYFLDEPFYIYRRRYSGSITSRITINHLIDHFITFIELLEYLHIARIKDKPLEFGLSKALLMLEIAISGYDKLNYTHWIELGEVINRHNTVFRLLKESQLDQFQELYDSINRHGTKKGFMLYCEYDRIKLLARLRDYLNQEIYIFPCGIKGQYVARILKKEGFHIVGFLDNDPDKRDLQFEGLICNSVDMVKRKSDEEEKHTCVIISPPYFELNDILNNQLLNELDYKGQIIIKDDF